MHRVREKVTRGEASKVVPVLIIWKFVGFSSLLEDVQRADKHIKEHGNDIHKEHFVSIVAHIMLNCNIALMDPSLTVKWGFGP